MPHIAKATRNRPFPKLGSTASPSPPSSFQTFALIYFIHFSLQWSIWGRWHRTSGRRRSSRRWGGSCSAAFSARHRRPRNHHRGRIRVICRCNSADSPGLILPRIPVSCSIVSIAIRLIRGAAATERRQGNGTKFPKTEERESGKRIDPTTKRENVN